MPAPRKYANKGAKPAITDAQLKRVMSSLKPAPRRRAPARKNYQPRQSMLAKLGSSAGGYLGGLASRWLGMGAYEITKNTIVKPSAVPIMHSDDSSVRLRHKEYIQDVVASNAFSNESFSINPGLSSTFPFLSGIAQNFEMYRIHGLVFTFKSNSGDSVGSTTTSLGSIYMATDYNSLDSSFTTKQGMLATMFSNSGKPSEDIVHPIECAPQQSGVLQRYIRTGSLGDVQSSVLNFDWGNFQLASSGQQATATVGELWVSYDIELFNPQSVIPRGLTLKNDFWSLYNVSNASPLGISPVEEVNTLGTSLNTSLNTITLPANLYGHYEVIYQAEGSSTASCTLTLSGSANTTGLLLYNNKSAAQQGSDGTVANFIRLLAFKLTDPTVGATLTFSSATLPTSVTAATLQIVQINGRIGA
jgi:hypothetical protein